MTIPKALPNDLIDSLLANYKKPEDLIGEPVSQKPTRNLWNLRCSRSSGVCMGIDISLNSAEAGKPIHMLDVINIEGMRLTSVVGKVATITWPKFVTITVDLEKNASITDLPATGWKGSVTVRAIWGS